MRNRGDWLTKEDIYFLPTYHPSALLHDEGKKVNAWEDFKLIGKAYHKLSKQE